MAWKGNCNCTVRSANDDAVCYPYTYNTFQGIRSYTVLNDSTLADELNHDTSSSENLESFGYWEDDSVEKGSWRGGNVGEGS